MLILQRLDGSIRNARGLTVSGIPPKSADKRRRGKRDGKRASGTYGGNKFLAKTDVAKTDVAKTDALAKTDPVAIAGIEMSMKKTLDLLEAEYHKTGVDFGLEYVNIFFPF